jgi:hypothetical protein
MKFSNRIFAAVCAALTAVLLFGGVAGASVTIPENPIPVSTNDHSVIVTVSYSGLPANQPLYLHQCSADPATPGFNFARDCGPLSQVQINGQSNPTGSGTVDYKLFRGDEPSGDDPWGCYAPTDTPSDGYTKLTSCWIRVTDSTPSNNTDAQSVKFSFVSQGAPVPEAPTLIVLPFIAAGVIGAAWVWNRRRVRSLPVA